MPLRRPAAALLLAVLGSLLGTLLLAAPASAQAVDRAVATSRGDVDPGPGTTPGVVIDPARTTAAAGDALVLTNADGTSPVLLRSTSDNWSFDSGPLGVAPGRTFRVDGQLPGPGTYRFTATYPALAGEPLVAEGTVVVPVPAAAPGPAPSSGAAPAPAGPAPAQPAPGPAPGEPAPAPGPAGSGTTALPGFSGLGIPGTPAPVSGQVFAPQLAPPLALPALPGEAGGPLPSVAITSPSQPLAVRGLLPGADTARELGLPAVLALVLAGGVLSLLVRVLLAEPVARRPLAA